MVISKVTTWWDIRSKVESAFDGCMTRTLGRERSSRESEGVTITGMEVVREDLQAPSHVLSEKDVCHDPNRDQILTTINVSSAFVLIEACR